MCEKVTRLVGDVNVYYFEMGSGLQGSLKSM